MHGTTNPKNKECIIHYYSLSSTSAVTGEVEDLSLSSGILPHVLLRGMVLAESAMPPQLAIRGLLP